MYYLGHQGWTDFLSQFSLYRHFITQHNDDTPVILVNTPQLFGFVYTLFSNLNVTVELVKTTTNASTSCVFCHLPEQKMCPRKGIPCQFVDTTKYSKLQGLCCFDEPSRWFSHIEHTLAQGDSFVHAFYSFYNLPFTHIWEHFDIPLDDFKQIPLHITKPYQVVHSTAFEPISNNHALNTIQSIPIDSKFDNILDALPTLLHASQIHVIPSVYAMLIYLCQQKFGVFNNIPVLIHTGSRDPASNYKNLFRTPHLDNWTFL